MSGVFVDRVCLRLIAIGALSILATLPAQAETYEVPPISQLTNLNSPLLERLRQRPAMTVTEWIAQIEASLVQITGVQIETTETVL